MDILPLLNSVVLIRVSLNIWSFLLRSRQLFGRAFSSRRFHVLRIEGTPFYLDNSLIILALRIGMGSPGYQEDGHRI
jgi:hypothetical protein